MSDIPAQAFTTAAIDRIHALLDAHWSAAPEVCAASAIARAADRAAPRSSADYARVIAGVVAAGGTKAEVAAFLRGEEESLLGAARTAPRELAAIGRGAWLAARGRTDQGTGEDE